MWEIPPLKYHSPPEPGPPERLCIDGGEHGDEVHEYGPHCGVQQDPKRRQYAGRSASAQDLVASSLSGGEHAALAQLSTPECGPWISFKRSLELG